MHTSTRGEWSRYETSAYRQARREGMPLGVALSRARSERVAHKILPPRGVTYGDHVTSWRLDSVELTTATCDPITDALFGTVRDAATGERILSAVTAPDGARVVITVRRDDDATPDGDAYSPEDVAAWQDDEWHYVIVEAVVTLPDGREGYDCIGGVAIGDHWGVSWEAGIIHVVPSLVSGALDDAASAPADVTPR